MRIAMLIPEFPGQTHAFFWREIAAIEDAGVEVRIFSTRKPPPAACPHDFRDAAVARTTYLFPPSALDVLELLKGPGRAAAAAGYIAGLSETSASGRARLMALLPSAARLVRAAGRDGIEHVHIHSCANAAHLGALAHILADLRYSLTLHGDLDVYGTDHGAKFARAAFVSGVTRPLAKAIQGVRPEMSAPVVMMGVDTDRFTPGSPDRNGPFELVSVARLNPTKGHIYMLRALAKLREMGQRDIRYQLAGNGPAEDTIRAEIASLGLEDQVELLGSVSEDRVLELLKSAHALALPSFGHGEAAPVAVMEAMACGLPVISSVIGGVPDMIEDGVDGLLVAQQDVDGLAAALKRLVEDPAEAAKIGAAARETATRIFDYRANAQALLKEIRNG